jgi:uncharacterized protein (DUF2126 family)
MGSGRVYGQAPAAGGGVPRPISASASPAPAATEADSRTRAALDAAIADHDRAAVGPIQVWLGAEPTFTDRYSESREWLCEALGADKESRARQLLGLLLGQQPGAVVLRPLGRQYAGEPQARWAYGLYSRRSGEPLWSGPPDRFEDGAPSPESVELLPRLRGALIEALAEAGWFAAGVSSPEATPRRVLCRRDGKRVPCDPKSDARLARESIHARAHETPPVDQLAAEGALLFVLHAGAGGPDCNDVWIELPALPDVDSFVTVLDIIARAAREAKVGGLGLRGFPPPIDDSVAWTTLTPDPAVLEVNQAPESTLAAFHRSTRTLFELAAGVGLSPYRLHYNGAFSDSGGGGQLTFGGPSPTDSPFFRAPQLLPRLIRYLIRHPSISYWFATQYVGGSSQSPRPDEGVRESFLELEVGLEQLARLDAPRAEMIWGTLCHFLADASGNPHRSELNIEKLCNRFLPGRGCLGLVEFRALAMPASAELATARALLLRSLIVMLSREDKVTQLTHWGDSLHDRFALPFFLRRDLREVFADLKQAGLGLGSAIEELLLAKDGVVLGSVECGGYRLVVEQALEFWPLVGDVASQEVGGSRLVDASTSRIQVRLDPLGSAEAQVADFSERGLRLSVKGHVVPLRTEQEGGRPVHLMGLRFRSFMPWSGLHPAISAEKTVSLTLQHASGEAVRATLYPWRPNGEAYPGLPQDPADAAVRRAERFVVEPLADAASLPPPAPAPVAVTTQYCVDLRRLP